MTHLGLFEGIGGFSLAARWAGWHTPVMVEWNLYCQAVLKKNFPNATIFGDINEFDGRPYAGKIDIVTGGFPCQPYSHSGKRAGNDDDRALWPQMLRVIREVSPRWVVGENVAGILSVDGGRVLAGILADLENAGYSTEIYSIPAIGVGAPHERERVWIVAHCDGRSLREWTREVEGKNSGSIAHTNLQRCAEQFPPAKPGFAGFGAGGADSQWFVANPSRFGKRTQNNETHAISSGGETRENTGRGDWGIHWLPAATRLCRMDDGFPAWLDGIGGISAATPEKRKAAGKGHRIEALGNAIVPHIAYQIFQAINEYEKAQ